MSFNIEECKEEFLKSVLNQNFWENIYEKKPYHFSAKDFPLGKKIISSIVSTSSASSTLTHLISQDDYIEMLLKAGPEVKMYKKGVQLPPNTPPHLAYLEGGSLIMNQSDRLNPKLFQFCHSLKESLHHVFAVSYLTPPDTFAVPVHNDDQDTFLWQAIGSKKWKIFQPPQELIYTEEMLGKEHNLNEETLPLLHEWEIQQGDILYLPRGYLHSATTTQHSSLHITLTTASSDYNWGAALEKRLKQLLRTGRVLSKTENELLRHAIPSLPQQKALGKERRGEEGIEIPQGVASAVEKLCEALKDPRSLVEMFGGSMREVCEIQRKEAEGREKFFQLKKGEMSDKYVLSGTKICLKEYMSCKMLDEKTVLFYRHDTSQSLKMPISVTVNRFFKALGEKKTLLIRDYANELDPLEHLCVAQLLLERGFIDAKH